MSDPALPNRVLAARTLARQRIADSPRWPQIRSLLDEQQASADTDEQIAAFRMHALLCPDEAAPRLERAFHSTSDMRLRDAVFDALITLPEPPAIAALGRLFRCAVNPTQHRFARQVLDSIISRRELAAADQLVDCLQLYNPPWLEVIESALARLASEQEDLWSPGVAEHVVERLTTQLRADLREFRRRAARVLSAAGHIPRDPEVRAWYYLASGKHQSALACGEAALPAIEAELRDPSIRLQPLLELLSSIPGAGASELLRKLSRHRDVVLRRQAIQALSARNDPLVARLIQSTDPVTRGAVAKHISNTEIDKLSTHDAIWLLAERGDSQRLLAMGERIAGPLWRWILNTASPEAQCRAVEVLSALEGTDSRKACRRCMQHWEGWYVKAENDRHHAAYLRILGLLVGRLGRQPSDDDLACLAAPLGSQHSHVRITVAQALGSLAAEPSIWPLLIEAAITSEDSSELFVQYLMSSGWTPRDETDRAWLMLARRRFDALADCGPPATTVVRSALQNDRLSLAQQVGALWACGQLRDPGLIQTVRPFLNRPVCRDVAMDALVELGDGGVCAILIRDAHNPTVASRATTRLVRLLTVAAASINDAILHDLATLDGVQHSHVEETFRDSDLRSDQPIKVVKTKAIDTHHIRQLARQELKRRALGE